MISHVITEVIPDLEERGQRGSQSSDVKIENIGRLGAKIVGNNIVNPVSSLILESNEIGGFLDSILPNVTLDG